MIKLMIISALVLLICVTSTKILYKFGVPILLIFIVLGMIFGSDGIVGIYFDNYDLVYSNLGIVFCNKNYIDELIIKIKKSIKNYGFFVGNFLGDSDDWNNEKNSNMKFFSVNDIKEKFKDFKIFYIAEKKYIKDSSKEKDKHWHIIEIYAQKIPN